MNISQNPYQISKASDPVLGQGGLADELNKIKEEDEKNKESSYIHPVFLHIIDTVGNLHTAASNSTSIVPTLKNNIRNISPDDIKQVESLIDSINYNAHILKVLLSNLSLKYEKNT